MLFSLLTLSWGCNDDKFLDRKPTNVLLDDQVWEDEGLVLSVLADLYGRFPDRTTDPASGIPSVTGQTIRNWQEYANFNEAFISAFGDYGRHRNQEYDYIYPGMIVRMNNNNVEVTYWDYAYIRDLNLFMQKLEAATELDAEAKERFMAEARFLRAAVYFEEVKRVGGVPLVLEPMTYDYSGDPAYLQKPRAKEHEIYDFVINELEEIKSILPDEPNTKSRATKAAALAMKTRAALYAASIAKYGTTTPQVSLPGGEVGIPAGMANAYYQTALTSAQEIINSGQYALYAKKPDLGDNFASIFYDKNNNPEVIFAQDFKTKSGSVHNFTIANQPRYQAEEQEGGRINPSLNLVQSFEKLDNTFAPLATTDAAGNPIYYDTITDIFAGRDARLWGTVILPGTQFKGKEVDIWAGYMLADGSIITADQFGGKKTLPGQAAEEQVVGFSGPIDNLEFSAQSGFYIRKYLDPQPGSGQRGVQSDVWWIRYRYAEVLLNAAEAAFELGQPAQAAEYMSQVRARAGLTTPLAAGDITFDRIVHERQVEFAFEGHQLWDMKRWRLAHIVWNGATMDVNSLKTNIGDAEKPNTMPFGLWPYKVHNPGSPTHGKWVFREVKPSQVTNADRWRFGNYYSRINDDIINNNPLIVRNPNQ